VWKHVVTAMHEHDAETFYYYISLRPFSSTLKKLGMCLRLPLAADDWQTRVPKHNTLFFKILTYFTPFEESIRSENNIKLD